MEYLVDIYENNYFVLILRIFFTLLGSWNHALEKYFLSGGMLMMLFLRNRFHSSTIICFLCIPWVYVHINTFFYECFEYETVLKGDGSHMPPEGYVIRVKILIILI